MPCRIIGRLLERGDLNLVGVTEHARHEHVAEHSHDGEQNAADHRKANDAAQHDLARTNRLGDDRVDRVILDVRRQAERAKKSAIKSTSQVVAVSTKLRYSAAGSFERLSRNQPAKSKISRNTPKPTSTRRLSDSCTASQDNGGDATRRDRHEVQQARADHAIGRITAGHGTITKRGDQKSAHERQQSQQGSRLERRTGVLARSSPRTGWDRFREP